MGTLRSELDRVSLAQQNQPPMAWICKVGNWRQWSTDRSGTAKEETLGMDQLGWGPVPSLHEGDVLDLQLLESGLVGRKDA